jgi:hypothetical protein
MLPAAAAVDLPAAAAAVVDRVAGFGDSEPRADAGLFRILGDGVGVPELFGDALADPDVGVPASLGEERVVIECVLATGLNGMLTLGDDAECALRGVGATGRENT